MKKTVLLCTGLVAMGAVILLAQTNTPMANDPVKIQTLQSAVEATHSTAAPLLLSTTTNSTPRRRLPVYVIPELLVVRLPDGQSIAFAPEFHVQELARKFPVSRVTNVIVYADGL